MINLRLQPVEKYVVSLRKKLGIHHHKLRNISPYSFEWYWRVGLILNINNHIDSVDDHNRSLL